MFSQMAQNKNSSRLDCGAFVDVNGKFTCNADDVETLIQQVNDCQKLQTFGKNFEKS